MTQPNPARTAGRGETRGASTSLVLRAVERLVCLDAGHGARAALSAAYDTLRDIPEASAAPAGLRGEDSDLLAALAELCEVIGWILFDAGRYRAAHRMNTQALALAELCGDRSIARLVLLNDSMVHTHTGHAPAALDTAARVAGPRPLPTLVGSLMLIRRAHATALLGGRGEAIDLIDRARSRFLDGASRHDPPWAWWIDEAELTGHQGWVLARLHDWDRAIPLLYEAATAPGPSYRHLFTAELLAALTGAGAWSEAEDLIAGLAPRAGVIGSVRTTETLAGTAALLIGHADAPANLRDAAAFLRDSVTTHPSGPDRPSR